MLPERKPKAKTLPRERRDVVAVASYVAIAVGIGIVIYGLANGSVVFVGLGVLAIILPIHRWFRIKRDADGTWTFEGRARKAAR
jgi:hypothetical protein